MWMNKTAKGRQEWGNDAIDGVGGGRNVMGGGRLRVEKGDRRMMEE